jgi:hypothetical protein
MAQLPDFQATPLARQVLENLSLGARARLALGADDRTRRIEVSVSAEKGHVTVTCPPWQTHLAEAIPEVVGAVKGAETVVCTLATTSILYVQERFDPDAESFAHLVEVAEKWDAGVEIVRLIPGEEVQPIEQVAAEAASAEGDVISEPAPREENGGILEDTEEEASGEKFPDCEEIGCGVPETMDRLIRIGHAGPSHTVHGGPNQLTATLRRTGKHSLIVVGDVYLSRGAALRKRLRRELISHLADHFRVPVIGAEELKTQYLFGARQWASLAISGALIAAIYAIVFTSQDAVNGFLSAPGTKHRVLAAAVVATFVPIVAFIVGGFYHNLLRLVKLD